MIAASAASTTWPSLPRVPDAFRLASTHNDNVAAILPLTPATWDALAALFPTVADSKWCWCQFWRKPGSNWSNTTVDENRADLRALVDGAGPAPGLVAIDDDGKAVGWVGLGPREVFERLPRSPDDPAAGGRRRLGRQLLRRREDGAALGRRRRAAGRRGRLRGRARRGHPRGVPGRHARHADLVRVGLHGHGRHVPSRRLRGGRADDLEGRLGDAARRHAPGP